MKLSEHISIFGRAIKFVYKLDKIYVFCIIFGTFLSAIIPYVPIYFSAKLVDALYIGASVQRLLLYVVLTVGIVFVLSLWKPISVFCKIKRVTRCIVMKSGNILKKKWRWPTNLQKIAKLLCCVSGLKRKRRQGTIVGIYMCV